ncbi:unnamed protein product, partial [Prorocentrum cordatum]
AAAPAAALAPLHSWLLEARGQQHLAPALAAFLDFRGGRADAGSLAMHLQDICSHFLAGVSLARMLASGLPGDGAAVRSALGKDIKPARAWGTPTGSPARLQQRRCRADAGPAPGRPPGGRGASLSPAPSEPLPRQRSSVSALPSVRGLRAARPKAGPLLRAS